MNRALKPVRLLTVEIRFEQDVVLARQRARQLAAALGFESQLQTRITTAVSEIARNAFQYAGGGWVDFSVSSEASPARTNRVRQTLIIEVRDLGPGIAQLETILAGRYRSESGLGIGIIGSHRLMDRVEVTSTPAGTSVLLEKIVPPSVTPRSAQQLAALVDQLLASPPAGPMEEVRIQNHELLRAMEEARARQDDLARLNLELAATNAGVLALYDELETLHRVGVMLASKLEFEPLIQAIIEVTTSLTDADVGAFFLREESGWRWRLEATFGSKADRLSELPPSLDLFGADFAERGLRSIAELDPLAEDCICTKFALAVAGQLAVRSCLIVPVIDSTHGAIGALLFASGAPRAFTERSERILASVALQAAVAIEKARLFQTVTTANDAKDQFFAMLSHELRTPLNPAMMIVSSLQADERMPADLREDIAIVGRNIRLEARLIDDLLDFNRLIKGKLELAAESLDAHLLIQSAIAICQEDLQSKGHRLSQDLRAPSATIHGDGARLQQVLWNVLKNAIKFTPSGGLISIGTSERDNRLIITITDTGRGIEAEAVEEIFSAFDQGRSSSGLHLGGLGLGLAIARMFVELHGGTISAASAGLGHGTTITIILPLCADLIAASTSPTTAPFPVASAHSGRILLVDDHPDTLHALTRLLKRRGFETTAVGTGNDALAALAGAPFDLFISDLGLPDCSGIDLLSRVRAIQDLPAIALSGYGMDADVLASRDAGFQMHITKPVDFTELMRTISELLARPFP